MKKRINIMLAIFFLVLLAGCRPGSGRIKSASEEEREDCYICTADVKLEAGKGEERASNGSTFCFLTSGGARRIINYLEALEDSETEFISVDSAANINKAGRPLVEGGHIIGAGSVAGSGSFAVLEKDWQNADEDRFYVEILGKNGSSEKNTVIDLPAISDVTGSESVRIDSDGYIHVAGQPLSDRDTVYRIFSPQGEVLWTVEFTNQKFWRMLEFPDGSIAVDTREKEDGRTYCHRMIQIDCKSGEKSVLFKYEEDEEKEGETILAATCFNQEQWLLMSGEEIFLSGDGKKEKKSLFSWKKHGFRINDVLDISVDEAGNISVLYTKSGSICFMRLVPKPEEVHMTELAVTPSGAQGYGEMVAEFNRRHPDRQIIIRDDYEPDVLRTMILAGDGPALVDSELMPFRDCTDYWEPLNEIYDEYGLMEELNEAALKLGAVDGTFYGIVVDFYINTLISAAEKENWTYEDFLECAEDEKVKYIVDNTLGADKVWVACNLLGGEKEDSFYIGEDGKPRIRTEEVRKAIRLINSRGPERAPVPNVEGVKEGEVLCNLVYISRPEELSFYQRVYGEGVEFKGFPKDKGAQNLIRSSRILAIGKNADPEDMETAKLFAREILSKELQSALLRDINFHMSVRMDVLKEQIAAVEEETQIYVAGFEGERKLGMPEPDQDAIYQDLMKLIENSVPSYDSEDPYKDILEEEFTAYFSGGQDEEALIDHLDNRLGLYLKE